MGIEKVKVKKEEEEEEEEEEENISKLQSERRRRWRRKKRSGKRERDPKKRPWRAPQICAFSVLTVSHFISLPSSGRKDSRSASRRLLKEDDKIKNSFPTEKKLLNLVYCTTPYMIWPGGD
jgi:hypothetical protein